MVQLAAVVSELVEADADLRQEIWFSWEASLPIHAVAVHETTVSKACYWRVNAVTFV